MGSCLDASKYPYFQIGGESLHGPVTRQTRPRTRAANNKTGQWLTRRVTYLPFLLDSRVGACPRQEQPERRWVAYLGT